VQDVYILASKYGSQEGQRGCAFVRYASPQSCVVAINSLHGKYAMKAGELPLVVRYADPPKNRAGGANNMYGGNGRYGWPGAPPLWPGAPGGPGGGPPPGWPMPWNLGGIGSLPGSQGGMGGYPPWVMAQMAQQGAGYNFPPQQQQQGLPPQYQQQAMHQQRKPPQQHQQHHQQMGYGMVPVGQPGADAPLQPPTSAGATPLGATAWSEHHTPDGLKYFYNTATGTSSWDVPPELVGGSAAPATLAAPVSLPMMGVPASVAGGGAVGVPASSLASSMANLSLELPAAALPVVQMPMAGLPQDPAAALGFANAGLALGPATTASPAAWGGSFP